MAEVDLNNGFVVWTKDRDRCVFGAFAGSLNISFWKDGVKGKPKFGKSVTRPKFTIIKKEIEQLIKAPPESKRPIVFSRYVAEEKKYVTDFVLTFIKDSEMVYHLEIANQDDTDRCTFMSPSGIAVGSEQMSEADRSAIMIQALLDWMTDELPHMCVMSRTKWEPKDSSGSNNNDKSGSNYFS